MHGSRRLTLVFSAIVSLTVLSGVGCTKAIVNAQVGSLKKGAEAIYAYDDPIILGKALPGIILTNEGYISISPENHFYLISTSDLYYLYAMVFVESSDREHAEKLYLRGRELGLRVLTEKKKFKKVLKSNSLDEFVASLNVFEKEDVPALFATTTNWSAWIALTAGRNIEVLMDVPRIEAMMFRILELDEKYNDGAIHFMLGAYFGALSVTLGGQPEKSKKHFDKAFEISNSKMLLYHVAYAGTYAVQIQDKKLFTSTLEMVLAAPSDDPPRNTMANEIAKMKAKALLEDIDEYFL